jgi:hypothetical protein
VEKKLPTSRDKPYSFIAVTRALKRIVSGQPAEVYADPQRLLEMLKKELHSDYPQETSLIITPLKSNIVDILSSIKDKNKLEQKLLPVINRITSQYGSGEAGARWAAYSWAYALEKITENDYKEILKIDLSSKHVLSPLEKEVRSHEGSSTPLGIRFDKEIRSASQYHTLHFLSSIFRNNKIRIPIAVAAVAAVIVIVIYVLISGPPNIAYSIQIEPARLFAGDNATMTANASRSSGGSVPEYKWSYKINNESEVKSIGSGIGPKVEFQTPLSEKEYSLQVGLQTKDEAGSYRQVAEKAIMVEPVIIQFVLEWG